MEIKLQKIIEAVKNYQSRKKSLKLVSFDILDNKMKEV